jgi:repressor LexA
MLTKRQIEVLNFIQNKLLKDGYPPTLREISSSFKMRSVRTAFDHIAALEKKGYLKRDKGKRRGLRILRYIGLPVIGEISAGSPMVPLNREDDIGIDKFLNSEHLLLKVRGESMIDDGIRDKDIVVVKPQHTVIDGEIIACQIDGEVLVKRFRQKDGEIQLMPANKDMEPFVIKATGGKRFEVIGKVVALLRSYE